VIEPKDILEWCFVVGALDFGVFGFLYSVYATASFQNQTRPPIVNFLRRFCWAVALVLVVLTGLAIFIAFEAKVGIPVWVIIGCFIVLALFSLGLVRKME
jgi:hypothetical protein